MRCIFILLSFILQAIATAEESGERLNIPKIGFPYSIDAQIEQFRINISIPSQLDKLKEYPEHIAQNIRRRIEYRTKNIIVMQGNAESINDLLKDKSIHQKLEYKRNLKEIVISLHPSDGLNKDPLFRHWPLIRNLPKYTQIHIIVPVEAFNKTKKAISQSKFPGKIILHEVQTWRLVEDGIELIHATTRWAQDLFEVAHDKDGTEYIFVSASRWQTNDLSRSDNRYIDELSTPNRIVVYTPLFFRGGNLLLGKSTKKILFIGERELNNNSRDFYNSLFVEPNREEVLSIFKKITGADEIAILPNSNNLFHLDMAMSFISDGVALLINPVDLHNLGEEDKNVISMIHRILESYGFKVIMVPTTSQRVNSYQSPVNIVPYHNLTNNRSEALVPKFSDIPIEGGESLNKKINSVFHSAGIYPIFINDYFHSLSGNTHCAVSVLR